MIRIDATVSTAGLQPALNRLFQASGNKLLALTDRWNVSLGTPVFTVRGEYAARGWTEWTRGFQYGSSLLQYDGTGDLQFLRIGRRGTCEAMVGHVSHIGVHDHGFNTVSTYGTLRRLILEGRAPGFENDLAMCELALKVSGAIQASRWTTTSDGGFICSFNGPHSLFVDTIRTLRTLAIAHELGHTLMGEGDQQISLLDRLVEHAQSTARYNVYYGEGRDAYDLRGRVAHEAVFNVRDGSYRCPSTQQGYSPFTTWTRGLAWAILGFAELLEYFTVVPDHEVAAYGGKESVINVFERAARATGDFFIENTPTDGVPYWDTGAPGLMRLGDYLSRPADPFNEYEPVDSSAAAIAAQGFLRLGRYLTGRSSSDAARYWQTGLTVAATLLRDPYLSTDPNHEGLLLHVVYHRPNGWDHIPPGSRIPCGESAMWGDYHLRELALYLLRVATGSPYLAFFDC